MYNVLVFPGGSEISNEINKSLKNCKDITLYSVNSNIPNNSPYIYRNHFVLPSIKSCNWIDKLNTLIKENNITHIIPAYDKILIELVKNRKKIKAKVIAPPKRTCYITRSKKRTYNFFSGSLPVPKLYTNIKEITEWPVFLKPDKGQGSENTYKVQNIKELNYYRNKFPNQLILEYLPGKEFTVDCFTSRQKGLQFCSGRERIKTKNGISINSKTVDNFEFKRYAQTIQSKLEIYGSWFFQIKRDKYGQLKLLEIAPRIAGTMATNRVKGINFPLLSIYESEGKKISILTNDYIVEIHRSLTNKYRKTINFDYVYIDFDDTIVINKKVNLLVISFLYQCKNFNKKIILVTRSKKNILDKLSKYSISFKLFDKIHQVAKNESKSSYINKKNSIFIDDSFSERKEISQNTGVPTFDLSMLEFLIDYRN